MNLFHSPENKESLEAVLGQLKQFINNVDFITPFTDAMSFDDDILNMNYSEFVGRRGENYAYESLKAMGEKNIFRDLYIPTKEGKYSQIDLLVVTSTGIVVIESKNYSGWIFGSEHQTQWTQTFPNGQKYKLYNPIKQNQGHIYALSSFLGLNARDDFHSCILFGSECELMDVPDDSDSMCILQDVDLKPYMKYIHEKKAVRFSPEQMQDITTQLNTCTEASDEVKSAHQERVRTRQEEFGRTTWERNYQRYTQTNYKHSSPPPNKQTPPPPSKQSNPQPSPPSFAIYIMSYHKEPSGVGGWSAVINNHGKAREIHSKVAPPTTLNRIYLYGLLDTLGQIQNTPTLTIYSDCRYLLDNLPRVKQWKEHNWTLPEGNYVENADLWAQILSLTAHIQIKTELITENNHFGEICANHAKKITEDKPIPPLSSYP